MEFGSIQNVPLREIWAGEATHFTPWLAKNLSLLGSKLGMDLELEIAEGAAGDFSADIIATDLSSNRRVVIENQFGSTDHKHLGQIITYASVLNAGVVIWISESFRTEHKAAIDFLNLHVKEGLHLYAVEASVIRIDDSKPAFALTVLSMPNESAVIGGDSDQEVSETKVKYRSFFQELIDELRDQHHFTNARTGQPQNWYTFSSEDSKTYKYSASFAAGGRARVEVYIDSGDKSRNERLFDWLSNHAAEIDSACNAKLSWERLDTKRACRVAAYRDGNIDDDSETLAEIRRWMIERLLTFKRVFPPHFRNYSPESELENTSNVAMPAQTEPAP